MIKRGSEGKSRMMTTRGGRGGRGRGRRDVFGGVLWGCRRGDGVPTGVEY